MKLQKYAIVLAVMLLAAGTASADVFGTGVNQFTIDFLQISGDASSANGTGIGGGATGFVDPGDFGIAKYEITNDQWAKFVNMAGAPTGCPGGAYNAATTGAANAGGVNISALEGFQFVNWLNTSSGYTAAYKFVETTPGDPTTLTFGIWTPAEAAGGTNLFRHKDAYYFLPTEDEWVKAAYWNGTTLQTYATTDNHVPVKQVDANFNSFATGVLPVGSFPQELNGTYDIMGNVREVTESPGARTGVYDPNPVLGTALRGGAYTTLLAGLSLTKRSVQGINNEQYNAGIRVAAIQGAPEFDPGDFNEDGDVDAFDIDELGDAIRLVWTDAKYDLTGDSLIDTADLDMMVRSLVQTTIGNGTEYGDFNLDGLVDTTDLTRLATDYGAGDTWAKGNANRNIDLLTDTTDLTILATYFGFVATPDAIPEPATMVLLGLGACLPLFRRKRR